MYRSSLIISVYKNTKDLAVVLKSVEEQTFTDFETIISEDGDSDEMREFIKNYCGTLTLKHLTQEDKGWQKNKALNNAIRNAESDYLIFIDGDCVLHPNFVENHLRFAKENKILAGKRIKLGPGYSEKLRNSKSVLEFSKIILREIKSIKKDGAKFYEEGVYISPKSLFSIIGYIRKMSQIKGCNFSCYKSALERINGFNEDYVLPAIGEDIDLTWRFKGLGYHLYSLRNFAVQYHLYHKENWSDQSINEAIMEENKKHKRFVTVNGLKKIQQIP